MAATVPSFNVTEAFHRQLNTLSIKEFPCGYGTWRTPNVSTNRSSKGKTTVKSTSQAVPVIISGSSAQLETVESLQDLAVKDPYDVDCSWSNEAKSLREVAVKTPNKLTEEFILKFFKSLRIVDKKVTEIDEGLLRLKNLKQLTLSANLIKHVDSKRLPKGLQELELAANEIVDISPLCVCPPPLSHLGLGYNRISLIAGKMRASSWPHLLSLDLSFNSLSELCNTVNVLKTLPKLKNLVLQGNPFALVPGYRGYTIDSIRQLTILDDVRISADEKHFFKGLSKLKDVPVDEAQFQISVKAIKGVRMPEELKDPEINADYPKTEHKYHVEFQFLTGAASEATRDSPALSLPTISVVVDSADGQEEPSESTGDTLPSGLLQTETTESLSWAEDAIECHFSQTFHTRFLGALRDFIQGGIDFTVVKTKHMYVLEDPNAVQQTSESKHTPSAKSRPGSKMQKGQEKRKESAKGKEKEKAKDGKAKKSKQDDVVLFELPRKKYTLGSCHVPLSQLLEGEFEVETECICESGEETGSDTDNKGEEAGAKTDGSDKKKGTKDSADKHSKGSVSTSSPAKGKGGRGKSGKPEDKKVKEREKHEESMEDEEPTTPPPPLSIQVHIKLVHWKSAREAQQNILPYAVPSQAEQNDTPTLLL